MAGRPSRMHSEEDRRTVAKLYAAGQNRSEIADVFGVCVDTVTTWTQRADVQALVTKFTEERANRILRKTDVAIESRLEHIDKMETETILKIRKEFVPEREGGGKADSTGAMVDLIEKLTKNPDLAAALAGGVPGADRVESDED